MPDERLDNLDRLGVKLSERGFLIHTVMPTGGLPYLRVVNPTAQVLSERVMCERSTEGVWWYWWPWAQRIARADELSTAVDRVQHVLAEDDAP